MALYLAHHGIKGQKWGIRRYQNPDGTLTELGKKRLRSDSSKTIYKHLKKEFRNERAKKHGSANRWARTYEVGEKGQKLRDAERKNQDQWVNSKEFRDWQKKLDRLDKKFEKGLIDGDEYDRLNSELFDQQPKKAYVPIDSAVIYGREGKRYYEENYLYKGGAAISIARLQDIGYGREVAEAMVEKMAKDGYTLGDI